MSKVKNLALLLLVLSPLSALAAEEGLGEYLQFKPQGKNAGRLETSIVTFQGPDGLQVHLVAAVHIADRAYYQKLNRLFQKYDALLYEMVKPKDHDPKIDAKSQSFVSILQKGMKEVLELDFQLDGIDYGRDNFVHADMDVETFSRMQLERGENLFTLMLRAVLDDIERQRKGDTSGQINPFELIRALLSKDRARSLKLLLARQFKDLEARMRALEGEKGSVILTERNKVALKVLEKTIASGTKNIGIFYGAAHMPGLEERLLNDFGLKRTRTRWLVAWDIPPPTTGAKKAKKANPKSSRF